MLTAGPAGAGVLSPVVGRTSPNELSMDELSTECRDSMLLRLHRAAEAWKAPGWTVRSAVSTTYQDEAFQALDGGAEWFAVTARPHPRFGASVHVHVPEPPTGKGYWHEAAYFAADESSIREAALCAVVAGVLSRSGFNPRTVRELSRFRRLDINKTLPRQAQTLWTALMDAMHRAAGHHVRQARERVMAELPLLALHMGEDEWLEMFRLASVSEVHRS